MCVCVCLSVCVCVCCVCVCVCVCARVCVCVCGCVCPGPRLIILQEGSRGIGEGTQQEHFFNEVSSKHNIKKMSPEKVIDLVTKNQITNGTANFVCIFLDISTHTHTHTLRHTNACTCILLRI